MTIYRAFFVTTDWNGNRVEFSQDYYSEESMETGIADAFFRGVDYNGYITIDENNKYVDIL